MTTWVDVADSAVKIGLGALVGWLSAYTITRLNQKHEITKEQRAKRRELVESVAIKIESYVARISTAFSYIQSRYKQAESSGNVSGEFIKKYKEAVEPLGTSIDLAGEAEAKLLLLGQVACANKVRELYVLSDNYMQLLLRSYNEAQKTSNLQFPIHELEGVARQIGDARRALLNDLAKLYEKY